MQIIGLALCSAIAGVSLGQISIVDPSLSFDGIDEIEANPTTVPADPDLAVSEHRIIQVVNHTIRTWDRSDLSNVDDMPLDQFFMLPDGAGTDPRIIYDSDEKRFVATVYGLSQGDRRLYARISPPEPFGAGNPLVGWFPVELQGNFDNTEHSCATGDDLFTRLRVDQPTVGYSADHWAVSAWLEGITVSGTDTVFYFIDKVEANGIFATAGPFFAKDFEDQNGLLGCTTSETEGVPLARPVKGSRDAPFVYFVGVNEELEGSCDVEEVDSFNFYAVKDPFGSPSMHFARVQVGCFADQPPCAPTNLIATEDPIGTLDARVMSAQWAEEIVGTRKEAFIWMAVTTGEPVDVDGDMVPDGDQSVIRWYKIKTNDWPMSTDKPAQAEAGRIVAPSFASGVISHLFYPAAAVRPDGTLAMVFGRSSEVETASLKAWARLANGMQYSAVELKASPVGDTPDITQDPFCARWGDYYDIERDPVNDTFWGTGTYMKSGSSDPEGELWGTWIANFDVD